MEPSSKKSVIWSILLLVLTTTIVRVFFEFFSNPDPGMLFGPWYGFLQYFVFFLAMALGIGTILGLLIKEPLQKWIFIIAKSLPIVFLAPIIDLLISHGKGICMGYLGSSGGRMIYDFFTFGGTFGSCGISIGMRIEILIILVALGVILWKKTRTLWKIVAGVFLSYFFIFLNAVIPGIFGITAVSSLSTREFVFFVSSVHFLTAIALLIFAWFSEKKSEWHAWMKNTRWERIAYYLFLAGLGTVTAYKLYNISPTGLDIIKFLIALISITASGWAAAVFNDIADQDIDAISNSDRPLHVKNISLATYKNLGWIFLTVSLIGALLINYPFFFLILGTQGLYATYSLRASGWKKHFLSSSATIGLAGIFMTLAGYFSVSPDQSFSKVPLLALLFLFITLAILSNAKDFKDVAGNRACGIKTLPVVFGTRRAGFILSLTLSVWLVILGIILKSPVIAFLALPWIILDLVIRKRIPEYVRFLIIFVEIVVVMALF